MIDLMIYTDPHIGLTRAANTTRDSALRWRDTIFSHINGIAESYVDAGATVACGGDVFDKYSNTELAISQGTSLLLNTHLAIAGNHDVTNSVTGYGSLQLVDEQMTLLGENNCSLHFEPGYFSVNPGLEILTVPHHLSQDDYVKSLRAVAQMANDGKTSILLTHCNYDVPEHWVRGETTLNISPDLAQELLKTVDYLVIGHEHTMKTALGGRVILPGSPFPTAFDNIEDKYILRFDGGKPELVMVWAKKDHYEEVMPHEIDEAGFEPDTQFVVVNGETDSKDMLGVMRRVGKAWTTSPRLLGLKMDLKTTGQTLAREAGVETPVFTNIAELIANELQSKPDMMSLWNRLQEGTL